MSTLKELLKGVPVEWKTLGEVSELKRGTTITAKSKTDGTYPVVSGGQKPAYLNGEYNREGETITIAGSGAYAGHILFWNEPIFVSDAFSIKPDLSILNTRYIYVLLLCKQDWIYNLKRGVGVPHVYSKDVAHLKIPIPYPNNPEKSLEIQQKIVKVLDELSEQNKALTIALTEEIDNRKKQYEYYREELFRFEGKGVEWKILGDENIGVFTRGSGLQKKDFTESGVGCIHYGQVYTFYNTYAYKTKSFVSDEFAQNARKAKKGDLVIATTSENDEDVCKAVAWLGDEDIAISSDACFYSHKLNPKYISYYFQTEQFQKQKRKYITGTKVRRVNVNDLEKILIPKPATQEQERIVRLLDKFDEATKGIIEALQTEIDFRNKQYEYYRNQLLAFNN